jgi:hypothetical protein
MIELVACLVTSYQFLFESETMNTIIETCKCGKIIKSNSETQAKYNMKKHIGGKEHKRDMLIKKELEKVK